MPAAEAPPWRERIEQALMAGADVPASRYLQLATLGLDGAPRNRTVVFRGFGPAHALLLLTHRASGKCAELAHLPRAELAWYLPCTREQFRLAVTAQCHGADAPGEWQQLRRQLWRARGAAGQAEWLSLRPAQALTEPVDDFVLVGCQVHAVDHLELACDPHRQQAWAWRDGRWHCTALRGSR
ncbi:MAG: pyridoxamine 5'-phosphate oxidase family protein [Pseudomonadota bacterium]|nr:pyridoxamine 5'-phosphate oxidase family protein [Pseudomonadota bacterium]